MSSWRCVGRDGRVVTFTEEALRAAVARGEVAADSHVWREGFEGWEPIEAHFPRRASKRPAGPLAAVLWTLALLLATSIFVVAGAASLATLGTNVIERIPPDWMELVWIAEAAGLAGAALLLVAAWWQASRRWTSVEGRGLVRILVVIVAAAGVGVAGFQAWQSSAVGRIAIVSEMMRDYTFAYDAGTRTLRVKGQIGPGFAEALEQQVRDHSARRIEITSPGGLIDEALIAARRLEARGGMTVVARELCASACVMVLMGGERRLATYDMTIDFHASSSISGADTDFARYGQRQTSQEIRTYLVKRGAPEAYVREADRLGAGKLYRVPALILAEAGTLTGLLDEEAPISLAVARDRLERTPYAALAPQAVSLEDLDLEADVRAP